MPAPGSPTAGRALGEFCLPIEEYSPTFRGFAHGDVTVEASPKCASGTCLVNPFAGRVTCLYGGEPDGVACETPSGKPVTVTVPAQAPDRSPDNSVYCSCRCDGPDPSADYCQCGAGFECLPLSPIAVAGSESIAGSYCVKAGTAYENRVERACNADEASCGEAARYDAASLGIELSEAQQSEIESSLYLSDFLSSSVDPAACLPRLLPVTLGEEGLKAACRVFEVRRGAPGCAVAGRSAVTDYDAAVVRQAMADLDACSGETDCNAQSVCEIPQITESGSTCLTEEQVTEDGWCYVSEPQGLGNADLVAACNTGGAPRRKLRWGGAGMPTAERTCTSFARDQPPCQGESIARTVLQSRPLRKADPTSPSRLCSRASRWNVKYLGLASTPLLPHSSAPKCRKRCRCGRVGGRSFRWRLQPQAAVVKPSARIRARTG